MRQNEVFPYYKKCCSELASAYHYLQTLFEIDSSVAELCGYRGYVQGSEQYNLVRDLKLCMCYVSELEELGEMRTELGLITRTDRFLLDGRFIIPVYDISGNLVSLIGYFPDEKKYITIPSPYFSKDVLFFNIDHAYRLSWEQYGGTIFLVEGIFDCLSLRAIGLPAIATMGGTVSVAKGEFLKQFRKVVYIPDNDNTGRRALNRHDKVHGWRVPPNAVGIRLSGVVDFNEVEIGDDGYDADKVLKVKDIDNLIAWFDASDIRDSLLEASLERREIVDFSV